MALRDFRVTGPNTAESMRYEPPRPPRGPGPPDPHRPGQTSPNLRASSSPLRMRRLTPRFVAPPRCSPTTSSPPRGQRLPGTEGALRSHQIDADYPLQNGDLDAARATWSSRHRRTRCSLKSHRRRARLLRQVGRARCRGARLLPATNDPDGDKAHDDEHRGDVIDQRCLPTQRSARPSAQVAAFGTSARS